MSEITHVIHLDNGIFLPGWGDPSEGGMYRYTRVREIPESLIACIPLDKIVGRYGKNWLVKVGPIRSFDTSGEAWAFMRECDAKGIKAGFPSLSAPYTVEYEG